MNIAVDISIISSTRISIKNISSPKSKNSILMNENPKYKIEDVNKRIKNVNDKNLRNDDNIIFTFMIIFYV